LFVSHLKTINAALQTMTAPQQQEFVARIAEKEGIRITPVRGNDEAMHPAAEAPQVQLFRDRIRELFGAQANVYVRGPEVQEENRPRARPQTLWVRLPAGERDFWVAFPRGRIERDPSTAFVEWGIASLLIAVLASFFIVWKLNRPLGELARSAV